MYSKPTALGVSVCLLCSDTTSQVRKESKSDNTVWVHYDCVVDTPNHKGRSMKSQTETTGPDETNVGWNASLTKSLKSTNGHFYCSAVAQTTK